MTESCKSISKGFLYDWGIRYLLNKSTSECVCNLTKYDFIDPSDPQCKWGEVPEHKLFMSEYHKWPINFTLLRTLAVDINWTVANYQAYLLKKAPERDLLRPYRFINWKLFLIFSGHWYIYMYGAIFYAPVSTYAFRKSRNEKTNCLIDSIYHYDGLALSCTK